MKYPKATIAKGNSANRYSAKVHLIIKAEIMPEIIIPIKLKKRATLSPMAFYILNAFSLKELEIS